MKTNLQRKDISNRAKIIFSSSKRTLTQEIPYQYPTTKYISQVF